MINSKDFPYSSHNDPYTETSTNLRNIGDLRKVIEGFPDEIEIFMYGCPYDTAFNLECEIKTQECIEHSGKRYEKFGLIFQLEG